MEAAESAEEEQNLFDHYYADVSKQDELSRRASQSHVLRGQAAFFNLVSKLEIPILDRWSSQAVGQDALSVGRGASYDVTRGRYSLDERVSRTTSVKRDKDWKLVQSVGERQYVTKRIVPDSSPGVTDSQRLAAITNEVRILGQESLRKSENLVSLICVAWDELPSSDGRHWPRLLLEPADIGHLGDLLTKSAKTFLWGVRAQLMEDVIAGLSSLHSHGVAHCDLKPENVLVFRRDDSRDIYSTTEFVAKICDFGFSVVITDYAEDATFCERLGTEPWTSPELTFGDKIPIKDLPMSDVYSLGLLIASTFMNGENPFNGKSADQVLELKRLDKNNPLRLSKSLLAPLFSKSGSNKDQKLKLSVLLARCLAYYPRSRPAVSTLKGALVPASSRQGSEQTLHTTSISLASTDREVFHELKVSIRDTLTYFIECSPLDSRPALTWLFRTNADSWGLIRTHEWNYVDERLTEGGQIPRLTPVNPPIEGSYSYWGVISDDLKDIPDFEDSAELNPNVLPPAMGNEIVEDLLGQLRRCEGLHRDRVAEIKYQLAAAYFEGTGLPKNPDRGLQYLEDAALHGSLKALAASHTVFASMGRAMPVQLSTAVKSRIPQQAKDELMFACAQAFSGRISGTRDFSALKRWQINAFNEYRQYIKSREFSWVRYTVFLGCLIIRKVGVAKGRAGDDKLPRYKDFDGLPGYGGVGNDFDTSVKTEFIKTVKDWKCVESTNGHLTLLQQAAATGDLELVKTLVSDLGANIESCGETPGATPLWLSCAHGHIEVFKFLLSHGADVHCREALIESNILHFLNQFTHFKDIGCVFEAAITSGISSNDANITGTTPLISTFLGYDFSEAELLESFAAKILLAGGGNILLRRADYWAPLSLAVRKLDAELLEKLLESLDASKQPGLLQAQTYSLTAGEAKSSAFVTLLSQTEFYRSRVAGPTVSEKLAKIVNVLLDDDMLTAYTLSDRASGSNPLLSACGVNDEDVATAVLRSNNCPPIDAIGPEPDHLSPLSAAVERNNFSLVLSLLAHGADPLLISPEGQTIFHRAAQFAPALLIQLLENIELGRINLPAGHDAHTVVAMRTPRDIDAFAFAVIEGSPGHLRVAEAIRQKYHIDHESYDIDGKGTLLAWLIDSCITRNIFTLEPLEYLMGLGSKRGFVADARGQSLLQKAVEVNFHAELSSNATGYAALRLLLRKFPGRRHIEASDGTGYNVIHSAVGSANIHALEIIDDHLKGLGEDFDANARSAGIPPPLSLLDHDARENYTSETGNSSAEKSIVDRNKAKTYSFMRNRGAYLDEEFEPGIVVCLAHGRQDDLPIETLVDFLERLQTQCELEWQVDQDEVPFEAQETKEAFWVVDIRWCHDRFRSYAKAVLADDLDRHVYRLMRHHFYGTHKGSFYAWTQTKHNERVNGHRVEWTRKGRCWTEKDVHDLIEKVKTVWKATIPRGKEIRRQATYVHSSLQLPENWNAAPQRNHFTLYNYSSAEDAVNDLNESTPAPAGYRWVVTRNPGKDYQGMWCWDAFLTPIE